MASIDAMSNPSLTQNEVARSAQHKAEAEQRLADMRKEIAGLVAIENPSEADRANLESARSLEASMEAGLQASIRALAATQRMHSATQDYAASRR